MTDLLAVVGAPGFEPGTSASRTLRANQAALRPVFVISRLGDASPPPEPGNSIGRVRHAVVVEPERDWVRVVAEEQCEECGFRAAALARDALPGSITDV